MYSRLDDKDIESELSHAYLHAVASAAGIGYALAPRHVDNRGIDVTLTCWEHFKDSYKEEIDVKVQLKASIKQPSSIETHFAYFFKGAKQYDVFREETTSQHRLLIVLFLPTNKEDWLKVSPEQLILKNAAHWVSLRGAKASSNTTGTTIYIPKEQLLTPDNLLGIFKKLSKNELLNYVLP